MPRAWSAAVKMTGAGLGLAVWVGWGCSDASERAHPAPSVLRSIARAARDAALPRAKSSLELHRSHHHGRNPELHR